MDKKFQWTSFYMELASALLKYKNNRSELIGILKTIFSDAGMNFPFKEKGQIYEDVCPFTIFGSFNKGITNANPHCIVGGNLQNSLQSKWLFQQSLTVSPLL